MKLKLPSKIRQELIQVSNNFINNFKVKQDTKYLNLNFKRFDFDYKFSKIK